MTALAVVFLWVGSPGCGLVGKGAGRRSECSRIADLSRSGEHKPAVDAAGEHELSGKSCPQDVQELVSLSGDRLRRADAFVHKALKRRQEGNLLSARANLQEALKIYPKYYWVQTLKKNMDKAIQAELDNLKNEARYLESIGDLEGALFRVQEARALLPGDQKLKKETARLRAMVIKAQDDRKAQILLQKARALLSAGRFAEAQNVLTEGDPSGQLGPGGEELLTEIRHHRHAYMEKRFSDALNTEKEGDLDAAAGHTLDALRVAVPGEPLAVEIVEFSRLLGMKLYSAGKLSRAKELWVQALAVEPGNPKLQGYLREVQTRLDNLDRIKKGGSESGD